MTLAERREMEAMGQIAGNPAVIVTMSCLHCGRATGVWVPPGEALCSCGKLLKYTGAMPKIPKLPPVLTDEE